MAVTGNQWLRPVAYLCWLAMTAAAQIGGGSLVGNVTDPSGAAIAGARVILTNSETGVSRETRTNEAGYYEFPLVPPGSYRLEAEHAGFRRAATPVFIINTGTRPRVDLRIEIGQVTEAIEVVAAAPVVNATTSELGVAMQQAMVEALPLNGRNFQQLVGLQAGVLSNPSSSAGNRGGI